MFGHSDEMKEKCFSIKIIIIVKWSFDFMFLLLLLYKTKAKFGFSIRNLSFQFIDSSWNRNFAFASIEKVEEMKRVSLCVGEWGLDLQVKDLHHQRTDLHELDNRLPSAWKENLHQRKPENWISHSPQVNSLKHQQTQTHTYTHNNT